MNSRNLDLIFFLINIIWLPQTNLIFHIFRDDGHVTHVLAKQLNGVEWLQYGAHETSVTKVTHSAIGATIASSHWLFFDDSFLASIVSQLLRFSSVLGSHLLRFDSVLVHGARCSWVRRGGTAVLWLLSFGFLGRKSRAFRRTSWRRCVRTLCEVKEWLGEWVGWGKNKQRLC